MPSITLLSVISASAQPLHSATISNCPLLFPSTVWTTFSLGGSYSSVISFCLFTLFILAFWRQEYWSGLPFPAPVDHVFADKRLYNQSYGFSIPGSGRSPGEGNGSHSSILSWSIPWTEEPGGLQLMGFSVGKQD